MTASTEAPRRTLGDLLPLRTRLLQQAQLTVGFGALDPDDPHGPDYMVAGIDETAKLLRQPSIWDIDDHDQMRAAFGSLCEKVAELADYDTDPDGYMDRLGRPARMGDVVRGAILADREHWLARLVEMART